MSEYIQNQDQIAALRLQVEILTELLLESNAVSKDELNQRVVEKIQKSLMLEQEKAYMIELAKF